MFSASKPPPLPKKMSGRMLAEMLIGVCLLGLLYLSHAFAVLRATLRGEEAPPFSLE